MCASWAYLIDQTHKYMYVQLTPYADRPSRRIRALVRSKALAAASVAAAVPAPRRRAATDAGRTTDVATAVTAAAAAAVAPLAAPTAPTLAERAVAPADRAAWETIGCDAREIGTILLLAKYEYCALKKHVLPCQPATAARLV